MYAEKESLKTTDKERNINMAAQSSGVLALSVVQQLDGKLNVMSKGRVSPADLEYMIKEVETANNIKFNQDELDSITEALEFMGVAVMEELKAEDIRTGRYRHFKGNEYEVIGVAKDSETLELMVVYRALYGEGELWVRPAKMWAERIEREGYTGPRFEYIGD